MVAGVGEGAHPPQGMNGGPLPTRATSTAAPSAPKIGAQAWTKAQTYFTGTRVDAVSDHCAGVLGWMFLLLWNTFSGSYLAFTSASRRYVSSP
jgi:hypothetical protein